MANIAALQLSISATAGGQKSPGAARAAHLPLPAAAAAAAAAAEAGRAGGSCRRAAGSGTVVKAGVWRQDARGKIYIGKEEGGREVV